MKKKVKIPKSVKPQSCAVYIGATPESIVAGKDLLLALLNTSAGDAVKQTAINAVSGMFNVSGATIHNCNFTVGK